MESMRTNDPLGGDPTAVFGRRCVAFAVDFFILLAVFVIAFLSSSTFEDVEDPEIAEQICAHYDNLDNGDICVQGDSFVFVLENGKFTDIALWVVVATALNLVVVAAITGGSVGKLAAGVRVVDQTTFGKAGIHKHLLRLFLWVIDAFPWFLLVPLTGLVFSLVSKGHRRVGDFVAKTLVVDKKYVGIPTLVPGVNDAALATAALPGLWSPPVQAPPTQAPPTQAPPTQAPSTQAPVSVAPVTDPDLPVQATAHPTHETQPDTDAPSEGGIEPRSGQAEDTAEAQFASEQTSQPGVDAPTWDAARDTYIQWDHDLETWMEWDESQGRWIPISQ